MATFLELVTDLRGRTVNTPGNEFPSSEHDNFFADRDTVASAHDQHSEPSLLPSFPEAFGGANDCHRQSFPSPLCPLYGGDVLQQPQCRQTELEVPLPPPSPANNVPRTLINGVTDLAPLHLGRNTASCNSYNLNLENNYDNPCQTRISGTPALPQWPGEELADGSFLGCLPDAPLSHSQVPRQCQYRQYQHQHQHHQQHQHQHQPEPFGNYLVNNLPPYIPPSFDPYVPSLDGLGLYLNLHRNTSSHSHCTTQQQQQQQQQPPPPPPPSTSQVPLPRPVFSPTTTAPSTTRPDREHAPFSNQAPPFSTPAQLQPLSPLPPILLPQPQSALRGDHFADPLQPQIPGADFDNHFSAPQGNDHGPFLSWHSPMTSAFGFNPDSFEPDTAMPSLANPPPARRRSSRRLSNSVVDLTKEESHDNLASSSPVPMAPPPTRKRRRSTAGGGTSASNTRRTSTSQAFKAIKTEAKRPGSRGGDTSLFDSSPPPAFPGDEDVLDLTEANEVSAAQKKIEARRVKLSKFQCVICMDDVSNLTVTHCGHLFCSECLHSALHIDSTKKSCPVCRTKVDLRSKTGKNTKSFYHLELKVMTATRKGKQPAAASR